jgi:PAS domain S-box-containing protein
VQTSTDPEITAQAALAESEARYRHLVETASDGIYRVTVQGYFTYANPVASRVLGGGETIIGHHFLEYVRQDYHDDIQHFYFKQIRERIPSTYYEFPAIGRNGAEVWLGQRVQIELDSNGTPKGLHAVARDISDRKRLEDALRQSDKMRVIGQLAGGIAHDFNSLVTAICGYSDLLIEALGADDPRCADAVEIRRAADKAARLTSQLLTFSRRELFRLRLINLNTLLADLRPMLLQLLGPTIAYEAMFDDRLGEIRADTAQLEQVLFNLALNARDAMPNGGTFSVQTEYVRVAPGELAELNLYPGAYALLTVHDTGVGMDEETRSKIFEPFFSTKKPRVGAGLGLATTYGVITQLGGRITAESTMGEGTTFRIYLPLAHSDAPMPTSTAPREPADMGSGGVVLLVDDEDGIRSVLTRVLESHGFRVVGAGNGVDALAKARACEAPIDVLVTDILMPKMSGFDLAEAIRNEYPDVRIVFMSGYTEEPDVRKRPDMAHVALLPKPFDSAQMLTAVRQAMITKA